LSGVASFPRAGEASALQFNPPALTEQRYSR